MKRNWIENELSENWSLSPEERGRLLKKHETTRLGFALLLRFFQVERRFPSSPKEIPKVVIPFMAQQLGCSPLDLNFYPWEGATIKRHRAEIREWCGFREITLLDLEGLKRWLIKEVIPQESRMDGLRDALLQHCRHLRIEPPAIDHGQRLILSSLQDHDASFCGKIFRRLDSATVNRMDALLQPNATESETEWTLWQSLKGEPGKAGVASMKEAAERLALVHGVMLPPDTFKDVPFKLLERFAKQATVEEPFELRRHSKPLKATLQASFLQLRSEELMDHLVELLVETVHKMTKKADQKIEQSLGEALRKAPAKMVKLYRIAKASVGAPKGVVEDVIFPAASAEWLQALIQEVESDSTYKGKMKAAIGDGHKDGINPISFPQQGQLINVHSAV